jgi:hypothetical protein
MEKQTVKQDVKDNTMETAIEALGKGIALLTDKGELLTSTVPVISYIPPEVKVDETHPEDS